MPTKILVAVDGSEHADKAVDVAADIARKYGATIVLLHAQKQSGSGRVPKELERYSELEHVHITERDLMTKVANDIVNKAIARCRADGCDNVSGQIVIGDPAKTIVGFAKDNGIDMIVMGRRGLGDLQGILFGSVSHKVSQLAECDCLTVR